MSSPGLSTAAPTVHAPGAVPASGDDIAAVRRSRIGGGLQLAGSAVSAGAVFVLVAMATNSLGLARAGVVLGAVNFGLLVGSVLKLGAEHGCVYSLAGDPGASAARRWSLVAAAVIPPAAVSVLVATGLALAAGPVAHLVLQDRAHAGLIVVVATGIPAFVAGQVLLGATRGLGTMGPTVRWGQVARPLLQLAAVATGLAMGAGPVALAALWVAPLWIVPVGAAVDLVARLGTPRPARPLPWRPLWRFTGPRAVADAASGSLERLDVVLVSAVHGPVATSLYSAANRLTNVAMLAMHALAQAAAPELRAAHARGDRATVAAVSRSVTCLSVTIVWPLAVHLTLSGAAVLRVFGPGAVEAASALAVLSIGLAVAVSLGPGDVLVLMTGRSGRSLANHLAAVATDVALIVLLVPRHGALGAAIAWSASILLLRVLSVAEVWRSERVRGTGGAAVALAAVAVATHTLGVAAALVVVPAGLLAALAGGLIGMSLHGAALLGVTPLRTSLGLPAVRAPRHHHPGGHR